MDRNQAMHVFGVKQSTGEYKLVFRGITLNNWLIKGEKTAKENGYDNFRFFSIGNLSNHWTMEEVFIS